MHSQGTLAPQCRSLALPQNVADSVRQMVHATWKFARGKSYCAKCAVLDEWGRVMHALQARQMHTLTQRLSSTCWRWAALPTSALEGGGATSVCPSSSCSIFCSAAAHTQTQVNHTQCTLDNLCYLREPGNCQPVMNQLDQSGMISQALRQAPSKQLTIYHNMCFTSLACWGHLLISNCSTHVKDTVLMCSVSVLTKIKVRLFKANRQHHGGTTCFCSSGTGPVHTRHNIDF